ncbi:hypothetical protein [Neobacillus sp. LXY-4]
MEQRKTEQRKLVEGKDIKDNIDHVLQDEKNRDLKLIEQYLVREENTNQT